MVMIVASVFIMFTILMIDQFIVDKKFYKEVEESLVADHLVHLAIKDVTAEWGEEIPKIIQGEISYPNGVVRYSLMKQDGPYVYIEFSPQLKMAELGKGNHSIR